MKSWHRPFGLPLWLIIVAALLFLLARHAAAATVNIGTLQTSVMCNLVSHLLSERLASRAVPFMNLTATGKAAF